MLLLPALLLPLALPAAPPPGQRNASQCVGGACGPGREQCGPLFPVMPRFHVKDVSCDENDPNGPFYDPVRFLPVSQYSLELA